MSDIDREVARALKNAKDLNAMEAEGLQKANAAVQEFLTDEKDGLAGMLRLPPFLTNILALFSSQLTFWIGMLGSDKAGKWTKDGLLKLNVGEDKADAIARRTRNIFPFFASLLPEIFRGFSITRKHFREARELEEPIRDLLAANARAGSGSTKITSNGNRVLAFARAQVNAETNNGFKGMMTGLSRLLPKLFLSFQKTELNKLDDEKKALEKQYHIRLREIQDELYGAKNKDGKKISTTAIELRARKRLAADAERINALSKQIGEMNSTQSKGGFAGMLLDAGGEGARGMMAKTLEMDHVDKNTSLKMCLALAEYMQGELANMDGRKGRQERLRREVVRKVGEVFLKVRKECGMPSLTDLQREQLDAAVEMIAEKIADGELHATALINLAGESAIMRANAVASEDQVLAELEKQCAKASPRALERARSFADRVGFSFRDLLGSFKRLSPKDKTLMGMLLPVSVLRAANLDLMEIETIHQPVRHAHERCNYLAAGVLNIAAIERQALREAGVSDNSIAAFQEMAVGIRKNPEAVHFGPAVEQMILEAGMRLSHGDPEAWRKIFDGGILASAHEARREREHAGPEVDDGMEAEEPEKKFSRKVEPRDRADVTGKKRPANHVARRSAAPAGSFTQRHA